MEKPDNTKRLLVMVAITVVFFVIAFTVTRNNPGPDGGDAACQANSYNC